MVDGPQSRDVVRLSGGGRDLRRLRCWPSLGPGHALSGCVPLRRHDRVRGLRTRALADVDLVSSVVGNNDSIHGRRTDLRVAHGWDVRMAVASITATHRQLVTGYQ